jgi:Arc/MetJ-type ribon-helix-helix transcriptional regulator
MVLSEFLTAKERSDRLLGNYDIIGIILFTVKGNKRDANDVLTNKSKNDSEYCRQAIRKLLDVREIEKIQDQETAYAFEKGFDYASVKTKIVELRKDNKWDVDVFVNIFVVENGVLRNV